MKFRENSAVGLRTNAAQLWHDKKALSWALYDCANSAFVTIVVAGFFPLFFKQYYNLNIAAELTTFRLGVASSIASFIVAFASPMLAALADAQRRRKSYLLAFTGLGAVATASLAFVPAGEWEASALLYALASAALGASIVFYDSFLLEASSKLSPHLLSSFGYALGYLGGGLAFLLCVVLYLHYPMFALPDAAAAVKISFVIAALWWCAFSLPIALAFADKRELSNTPFAAVFLDAIASLRATIGEVVGNRNILLFLIAYWIYIDGVNTVIKMALDYGASLNLSSGDLITALLMTQFVGFPSAIGFGLVGQRLGAKPAILLGLGVYLGVTLIAATISTSRDFYLLAITVGLVQGGVQALSRSFFASLIPAEGSAKFFSLFNLVSKFATILGPSLVGGVAYFFGSPRLGIMSAASLFLIGGFFLVLVRPNACAED